MTNNQDIIKTAAKRMCDQLAGKGVKVKHTAMLEALAEGFGLDNWRTLKAVIDAPRAPTVLEARKPARKALPLGEWQMWSVDALYFENDQQYGDNFPGRTPLEGAINAITERLTDYGLEIGILNVEDADGGNVLSPSFVTEIELQSNHAVLTTLLDSLEDVPTGAWTADQRLALQWLAHVLEFLDADDLSELTDFSNAEVAKSNAHDPVVVGQNLTPTEGLGLLCDLAEGLEGGVVALEARDEATAQAFYQVRAMCTYFADLLNDASTGLAEMEFEVRTLGCD